VLEINHLQLKFERPVLGSWPGKGRVRSDRYKYLGMPGINPGEMEISRAIRYPWMFSIYTSRNEISQ
jgi:hypothetical protein